MGYNLWEAEEASQSWRPSRDQEWHDLEHWFVEEMTGAYLPYPNEVDKDIGPLFRMFWEQPHEWQWFRPSERRGSDG